LLSLPCRLIIGGGIIGDANGKRLGRMTCCVLALLTLGA
jgi:hypothetical protein